MNKIELYRDIDLRFTPHPLSGDVVVLANVDAVKQSLRNILMLQKWDIPFNNSHGQINSMLFDQPDPIHQSNIQTSIEWSIKTLEPRVQVNEIRLRLSPDESSYQATIFYTIKSLHRDDVLDHFFQRVR